MSQPPYGQQYPEEPDRPYSGQPYSGQPSPYGQQRPNGQPPPYGQQSPYGQPAYGQSDPTSGQPVYGAPYGEPGSPAGGYPAPTPPKKSNALKIVLITLGILLVLCVGGGTAFYLVGRDKINQLADATASGSPTATQSPQAKKTTKISVVEPKTLNGRPKLTDKQFASIADEMQKDMGTVPDATSTVGALYGSVEKRNIVMIAAVAAPIEEPKKELDGMFAGAGFGGLKVSGITDVDPGPLGGEARCGKATETDLTMAVCGWADEGSMGMTISFFKSVSSAKAELPKIRGQVEKKST